MILGRLSLLHRQFGWPENERSQLHHSEKLCIQASGNPNELLAFYLRHRRTGPHVDALTNRIVPDGMSRIPTPYPLDAPANGVMLVDAGVTGSKHGLLNGDVIARRIQLNDLLRLLKG